MLSRIKPRLDQTLPNGNEGAGVVVAAGDSEQAQVLIGKTVAVLTGASYTQYCCVPMQACIVHHDGTILNTCSYGGRIQLGYYVE